MGIKLSPIQFASGMGWLCEVQIDYIDRLVVGALKSIYEMKCELLDKILNFSTQIVEIFLYRNFDGSKLVRPVFGRHLGFQNGRHLGPIFSTISKRKTLRELIAS